MQIDYRSDLNLEGEANESVEASISKENLPFIIDLITRQQYRNPIGSIVREITSNCFDAHIEANVDDAVVIDINNDELGNYIAFIDVGIGMSPERIKKIYLSYGESTKRKDDTQIGGFGLGGKSPLAYTDLFYVTTIYDKIKYEYIVHKGVTLPVIELLDEEPVEIRNGTTVKIYFKDEDDKYTFIQEARKQLIYFDNIYFRQAYWFNNTYQIYEGKNFKLRSDIKVKTSAWDTIREGSETEAYSPNIHLCIGKVPYPIDWGALGRKEIKIPIALKFEIGELIVTPERESVRYIKVNDVETKDIINKKLNAAISELKELYFKQSHIVFESLISYFRHKNDKAFLTIHSTKIDISDIITENRVKCSLLDGFIGTIKEDIYEVYNYHYRRLRKRGKGHKLSEGILNWRKLTEDQVYISKSSKVSLLKNAYIFHAHTDNFIVGKLTFRGWDELRDMAGLPDISRLPQDTNLTKQLIILKRAIDYDIGEFCINYDDLIPEKAFVEKRQLVKPKRQEDQITVWNYRTDKREFIKPIHFSKHIGFMILGTKENEELLKAFTILFDDSKYNQKAVAIFEVAESNYKHFKKIKNKVHVQNFIGDNKVFKHFATTLTIKKERNYIIGRDLNSDGRYFEDIMEYILPTYTEAFEEIRKHIKTYGGDAKINDAIKDSIIDVAKKFNLLDQDTYIKHQRLNNYVKRLELFEAIMLADKYIPQIVEYLVLKKKKVDPIWTNPEPYEVELVKESLAKGSYLDSVNNEFTFDTEDFTIFRSLLNYYEYAKAS